MERIAYVILAWNSRRHIAACLRAIYGITSLGAQIIVVDNGSADGTAELLEELARESGFSRWHFSRLFQETVGIPPAQYLTLRRL